MDSYIDKSSNRPGINNPTSNPASSAAGDRTDPDLKARLKEDARASKEQISQTVRTAGEEAKRKTEKKLDGAKDTAASTMDDLSRAADSAARTLQDEHHESLSHYVADIAHYVSNVASSLRNKNTDELINDAKRMARDNPALFIAGSVAIGLGIARLAKSGTSAGNRYDTRNEYGGGISSEYDQSTAYGRGSRDSSLGESSSDFQTNRPDLDGPSKSYTTGESLNDRF